MCLLRPYVTGIFWEFDGWAIVRAQKLDLHIPEKQEEDGSNSTNTFVPKQPISTTDYSEHQAINDQHGLEELRMTHTLAPPVEFNVD